MKFSIFSLSNRYLAHDEWGFAISLQCCIGDEDENALYENVQKANPIFHHPLSIDAVDF